jgi:hypothetical protein
MVNSSSMPSSTIATRLSSSSATLMSIFFFIPQTFVGAIGYPSLRAGHAWALEFPGDWSAGYGLCFPSWYTMGKFLSESVACYQGCANIRFTSTGMSESLWLGIFDQDSMARLRVQKADQPGQSLPRVLIDNRYATCLGSL